MAAICGLLPFVPTYAVAIPATGLLAARGRIPGGILLFALHWAAYYFGDTLILEDIPGGHPYLLSLGILGGIWTFDNPLQGCLLGPIFLSLLSAFYQLHGEFMGLAGAEESLSAEGGALVLDEPDVRPAEEAQRPPVPSAPSEIPGGGQKGPQSVTPARSRDAGGTLSHQGSLRRSLSESYLEGAAGEEE